MTLLSVKDVKLSFGGVKALSDVSLDLNRGEILGLIGPNGAGKTTLFNCISGVLAPDSGLISFEDKPINLLQPHQRAALGIARTFQNLQLWGSMTVLENCMTPQDALRKRNIVLDAVRFPTAARAEKAAIERARAVLHSLDLLQYSEQLAKDLSVGIQRRVEIARALCMRPKLVLLDEPASGLDADETLELAAVLARVRERFKVSMLLVDHDMSLVMRACDYIYVLDFGELIASGRPDQVRDDPKVISAYLGEPVSEKPEAPPERKRKTTVAARAVQLLTEGGNGRPHDDVVVATPGAPAGARAGGNVLEVTGLNAGYGGIEVIRDINIHVGWGEVVACIGANGAGKTTTLRAISGVIKPTRGSVVLDGVEVARQPAEKIVRRGMIHIPQGRGLFPKLTVEETLDLAFYSGAASPNLESAFQAFPVLKDRRRQLVGTLSGGQQQMVAMARALLVRPKLLLIDEMSQGLAPNVVQDLFERIEVFKEQGIAVFLVEQFVDSALSVADRAYVFEQGTVAHEAAADVLRKDQAVIASAYLGTAAEHGAGEIVAVESATVREHKMLEELSLRLPAEVKRALEERATKEGRDTHELVAELLDTKREKEVART